jgi:hypothetical protein
MIIKTYEMTNGGLTEVDSAVDALSKAILKIFQKCEGEDIDPLDLTI